MTSKLTLLSVVFYCKLIRDSGETILHADISHFSVALVQLDFCQGKICYQCDDKNPSSKLKFIGEKITRCNGVPFEKYATKTSRAFGAAVLTCYTVK